MKFCMFAFVTFSFTSREIFYLPSCDIFVNKWLDASNHLCLLFPLKLKVQKVPLNESNVCGRSQKAAFSAGSNLIETNYCWLNHRANLFFDKPGLKPFFKRVNYADSHKFANCSLTLFRWQLKRKEAFVGKETGDDFLRSLNSRHGEVIRTI